MGNSKVNNPNRNENQHPNESARSYARKLFVFMMEDVHRSASGREMTMELQTQVSDMATDFVDALMQAVRDDQAESSRRW